LKVRAIAHSRVTLPRSKSRLSREAAGSVVVVFVKICGITNEEDALLAVALGADAVGFVFAPSPRQVAAKRAYDIASRLPPEILTVGVFRNEHPDRIIDIIDAAGLKAAQLHGHEAPEVTHAVHRQVRFVIKGFVAGADALWRASDHGADAILIDSPTPGSGQMFDWSLIDGAPDGQKILLAGGLTPDNVATAVQRVKPWGVDVSTGVEKEPGRKDPVRLRAFIEAARSAAPHAYLGPDELPYDWTDE
jgi:phosphoribosylanthranilate isomerase